MARFVFQLDGVLRHRANLEHQCQRELALIQGQMSALDAELRALDASVRVSEADLRTNRLVGRLDLAFLAAHRRYAVAMQRKATQVVQKMAAVQVQLDRAKRNLAEAAKKRKIIEKLRERQYARWREQLERRDVAEMDDIGMQLGHDRFAQAGTGAA